MRKIKIGLIVLGSLAFVGLVLAGVVMAKNGSNNSKAEYVQDEIIVKFKDGVSEKDRKYIYKALGVISTRNGYGDRYHVLTIEDGKVREILKKCLKFSEIEYAEPNYLYHINTIPNDE